MGYQQYIQFSQPRQQTLLHPGGNISGQKNSPVAALNADNTGTVVPCSGSVAWMQYLKLHLIPHPGLYLSTEHCCSACRVFGSLLVRNIHCAGTDKRAGKFSTQNALHGNRSQNRLCPPDVVPVIMTQYQRVQATWS